MSLIAILIPTYNRQKYLLQNLRKLTTDILSNSLENDIEIIISNNASLDETEEKVEQFIEATNGVRIKLYNQSVNIGLEANALFVLEKATSTYVMYLGDDDFVVKEFLIGIVNQLKLRKDLYCILPSFQNVDYDGNILMSSSRDIGLKNTFYVKGFDNCLNNSYRGHQLSGLVFKRCGLLKSYKENGVHNLYPFVYFVSLSCLNGNTWHFPEYPVLVTSPLQKDKDWDYNINGLVTEIFDNYKKLPDITLIQRFQLEFKILTSQSWRYEIHLNKGKIFFLKSVYSIVSDRNTSVLTKIVFPTYVSFRMVSKIVKKCLP